MLKKQHNLNNFSSSTIYCSLGLDRQQLFLSENFGGLGPPQSLSVLCKFFQEVIKQHNSFVFFIYSQCDSFGNSVNAGLGSGKIGQKFLTSKPNFSMSKILLKASLFKWIIQQLSTLGILVLWPNIFDHIFGNYLE